MAKDSLPEFREIIRKIVQFNQGTEGLDLRMIEILDAALSDETKKRFLTRWNLQIYARVIKTAFENVPTADLLDAQINRLFNDQNFIISIKKEIERNYQWR